MGLPNRNACVAKTLTNHIQSIMKQPVLLGMVGLFWTLLSYCVHAWGPVDKSLVGAAVGAIGYACAAGTIPGCVIVAVSSIFLVVFTSWRDGHGTGSASHSTGRDLKYEVFHDIGGGHVKPYFDVDSLEVGVDHLVWDNEGNTFRASRHESGDPMLSIDLAQEWELPKRSTGTINSITITYKATGIYSGDSFTQADANAAAQSLLQTYSTGQGNHICAELINKASQYINFSFTPTSKSGIYPRSAFAVCGP